MKKSLLFSLAATLLLMVSCGDRAKKSSADLYQYSPFVEGFTAGKVSRFAPVYLIFNQSIPADKFDPSQLSKLVKMTPAAEGEWVSENPYTIVFRPAEGGLKRNTSYKVTADLSHWFDTGKDKTFSFNFQTYPLQLRANFEAINIAEEGEGYIVDVVVLSADKEENATVEALLKFSEKVTAEWEHGSDGKRHNLKISGLKAEDKKRNLVLSVAPNKLGVDQEQLLSVNIPGANDFTVYGVAFYSDPSRYVEVTFTEQLDDEQDMQGIAFIEDNSNETVVIDANKLRLYPDPGREGTINVFLGESIRSKSGLRLGEDHIKQVSINTTKPSVRFTSEGIILPYSSSQYNVSFQAVNLRGVVVKIIKIFENNMGQFLQSNQLDGSSYITRVGRLVARKVMFFDEEGVDLSQWNTFAIDLRDMVEPEPGAIYRIELSFNLDLSSYPCENVTQKTKEQIYADNEAKLKNELVRYDGGDYYYYYYDNPWMDGYTWRDQDNPCTGSYYYYNSTTVSRNILASNLGIIAKRGEGEEMIVLVHNIVNTNPENGVQVTLYNYQNQPVGSGTTGVDGRVNISYKGSKPYYLIASQGRQKGYLHIYDGNQLSMSSFDVSGEMVQRGIKGFIYGERGVWRPGDVIHLGFMLNDRTKKLPPNHPVTLELYTPLGQLYTTLTQTTNEMGIYAFHVPTEPEAPTGAWSARVSVGGASFSKSIRIETVKPNRLKIDLKEPKSLVIGGEQATMPLHVEWLQGAKARHLDYEIEATLSSTTTRFDKYKDFTFDDPKRVYSQETFTLAEGSLDENGDADVTFTVNHKTGTPGMMNISLFTRVYEESGDFSVDGMSIPYSPYKGYAGIRSPQVTREQLNTGTSYIYDLVAVTAEGKPEADVNLDVEIYKIYWYWWWSSDRSELAHYVSNSYNSPVKTMTLKTKADGAASFNLNFSNNEWGSYYIQVKNRKTGHVTGIINYYDWPYSYGRRDREGSENATKLTFRTDKEAYEPGQTMSVVIPSSQGSRAIVSVENGTRVLSVAEYMCDDGETTIKLPVTADMQPNAYVHVALLQPHGETANDLPIRMYGVVPFTVTSSNSYLHPVIGVKDEIRPEAAYEVTVSEKNGRPMAYTLAIVDEGLLDLTRFKTPDPWRAFNAREALGVSTWDMYNYVMGAYGGRIEQIFSIGGDDEAGGAQSRSKINRFAPVVQFEGPFVLKKGETKKHSYNMPNYNGRVRVMVVAGDGEAYGHTDKSVMVRKPVMLLGTLPRVIGTGEEMAVPATVFATENGVGKVKVTIETSGNMSVVGSATQELNFTESGDKQAMFRIAVGKKAGTGTVKIKATGKGETSVYETDIEIRSVRRPQVKVDAVTLQPGQSWKQNLQMPGADGTNSLTLEMSAVKPVNLASRLEFLIGYPHGCIEQITSKGFPQLYLSQFSNLTYEQEQTTQNAVNEVIRRMRSYQMHDGAFSYWPGGTSSYSWATNYATHFLIEAEAKGYLVPANLKKEAIRSLSRVAKNWKAVNNYYYYSEEYAQAYRLYVLALSGNPEMGAMNRLKETEGLYTQTRWMLAAAYAKAGRADVARGIIGDTKDIAVPSSQYDITFGSDTRDKAIQLITLCIIGDDAAAGVMANEISTELGSDSWMSTQTTAYALMAMSEYMKRYQTGGQMDFNFKLGSQGDKVRTPKPIWNRNLLTGGASTANLELNNTGSGVLFARIIKEGTPDQGNEEAYANGVALTVSYHDANGNKVDPKEMEQGVTFTAQAVVKNASAKGLQNLVITQIVPAGWEIINTRFLNEGDGTVNSDSDGYGISYQDYRDDRVYSYIDYLPVNRSVTIGITVTSVYPGRFYLPPVYVEAMYDHLLRANNEGVEVIVK